VWRGFDMIYLDSAGVAAFTKADDEDNGEALKSLGLAKQAAVARMSERYPGRCQVVPESRRSSGLLAVASCVQQARVDAMKRLRFASLTPN
jgi:hypothetical protein